MKYASFIANWVLGVLFFIISLLAIINSSFLSGLLLLIASLTLMPISRRFVLPKINEKMSPMIRAAFVSILFIGFVVSVQPNEAQLLAQKEIKLAEEAALLEQQKARLAAVAEEKQKMLAANAEARELLELTEHISKGGSYAFIEISDIDAKLFSGKSCSEVLGLRASLKPVKGSHPFGYVVNGSSGEIASISPGFTMSDVTYKMPNGCNIFAPPAQVERNCALDDPLYSKEVYELDEATGIVAKFGRLKRIGRSKEENTWKVITRNDGETLTSAVANLHKMSTFMNKPWKVERRTYICRG